MKDLDSIFSTYIRLRDADANGQIRCYCCGHPVHWKLAHNGHFFSRRFLGTRFNEENCHACCVPCNTYNNGNLKAYEEHLVREYGDGIIAKLSMLKNTLTKFAPYEIEEMKEEYRMKVKELKKEKGL